MQNLGSFLSPAKYVVICCSLKLRCECFHQRIFVKCYFISGFMFYPYCLMFFYHILTLQGNMVGRGVVEFCDGAPQVRLIRESFDLVLVPQSLCISN